MYSQLTATIGSAARRVHEAAMFKEDQKAFVFKTAYGYNFDFKPSAKYPTIAEIVSMNDRHRVRVDYRDGRQEFLYL